MSSQPRDWTQVSCIAGGFFTSWATGKPSYLCALRIVPGTCKHIYIYMESTSREESSSWPSNPGFSHDSWYDGIVILWDHWHNWNLLALFLQYNSINSLYSLHEHWLGGGGRGCHMPDTGVGTQDRKASRCQETLVWSVAGVGKPEVPPGQQMRVTERQVRTDLSLAGQRQLARQRWGRKDLPGRRDSTGENLVKWKSLSCVWLFATPWTIQSMEFSRPEYWSG